MKPRDFDPRRLDVKVFARQAGELKGAWPLAGFTRLLDLLAPGDGLTAPDPVQWSARGEEVPVRGGASQVWLHLQADAALPMVCQRCLMVYPQSVTVRTDVQFVADEQTAADLDADVEHEVLVFSKELDLQALIEDEMLLSLPLVPRHESCPQPLSAGAIDEPDEVRKHPFAALAELRSDKP